MRIVISSGHGKKIRGASSQWADEVDEARLVTEELATIMRDDLGVEVTTYHDDISTSQGENLDRIVSFHNSKNRDWDFSIHFNAYEETSTKPMGCEVLYASSTGEKMARKIVDAICEASGLINRGPKHRGDLAFLNNTECPACLLEICFIDSKPDLDIYAEHFTEICTAIGEAISGQEVSGERPPPVEPPIEPEPPEPPETEWPPPGTMPPISAFPPPSARRTLKKGMSGKDVAALQRVLGVQGDGHFGSITHTQVEAFQAATNLGADGIVGQKTWTKLDELYKRMRAGTEGLSADLAKEIVATAEASPLQEYNWPDRGRAAPGYLPGMALSYATLLKLLRAEHPAVKVMAKANAGKTSTDALAFYENELDAIGCHSDNDGLETLRTLIVMMISLGVRESSGKYFCGRDMSAENVEADTCEAGAWQSSWNLRSADPSIPPLLEEFLEDPTGFHREFREGISPDASDLDCYGAGEGATYQWLAKYSPLFALMVTAVGLRKRKDHWGPIKRKELTLKREAADLLKDVEKLVLADAV